MPMTLFSETLTNDDVVLWLKSITPDTLIEYVLQWDNTEQSTPVISETEYHIKEMDGYIMATPTEDTLLSVGHLCYRITLPAIAIPVEKPKYTLVVSCSIIVGIIGGLVIGGLYWNF